MNFELPGGRCEVNGLRFWALSCKPFHPELLLHFVLGYPSVKGWCAHLVYTLNVQNLHRNRF